MAVYTQLNKAGLKKIAAAYQLEINSCKPEKYGSGNSNFVLNTRQGQYMLTIVEERTIAETKQLAALLKHLKRHKFSTNRVAELRGGGTAFSYRGKPVLVKAYLPGKTYDALSPQMLKDIGVAIGKLHQIPAPNFLPEQHYYENRQFSKTIGLGIDPQYEYWLYKRLAYFKKEIPQSLPRGLVHGDIFSDNVLFRKGKIQAIIDFEEACNFYLAFDLGMAVIGLCVDQNALDLSKAQMLVDGYENVRKLQHREKRALQLLTEYAAVKTSSWRFWKYRYASPNPARANWHTHMAALAEQIRSIPKPLFSAQVFGAASN